MRLVSTLALALAVSVPLFATTGDISISAITSSKTTVTAGERHTVGVTVRNAGPDTVYAGVRLFAGLVVSIQAPSDWRCHAPTSYTDEVWCAVDELSAGEENTLIATVVAPRTLPAGTTSYPITATATQIYDDPNLANNRGTLIVNWQESSSKVDLALTTTTTTTVVAPRTPLDLNFIVKNNGPGNATNALVRFDTGGFAPEDFTFSGTNWTCSKTSDRTVACVRPFLAAGEVTGIVAHVEPQSESVLELHATLTAEAAQETNTANDFARAVIGVGATTSWYRYLIPITSTNIQGAFGSLWNTDISMIFLSSERPVVRPDLCAESWDSCYMPDAPLRRPFDARTHGFITTLQNEVGGQFVYVRIDDILKVRFNARVYDKSRDKETAGSEIPIVRQEAFTSEVQSMLNIPVAAQYRHTLRVYDEKGIDQTPVTIRVFANDELLPRATAVRRLTRALPATITSALLPTRPAYLQLDLRELVSLDGLTSVRVEVEPAIAQTKLWAFVAVTNNDTHHVTTISPQ